MSTVWAGRGEMVGDKERVTHGCTHVQSTDHAQHSITRFETKDKLRVGNIDAQVSILGRLVSTLTQTQTLGLAVQGYCGTVVLVHVEGGYRTPGCP